MIQVTLVANEVKVLLFFETNPTKEEILTAIDVEKYHGLLDSRKANIAKDVVNRAYHYPRGEYKSEHTQYSIVFNLRLLH